MDRVVDLVGGQATSAYVHTVSVEDVAGRASVDAEPVAQLIGGRTGCVALDEFLDLVGVELACPSWCGSVDGRWSRFGGVG